MTMRRKAHVVYRDVPAVPEHDDLPGRDLPDQHTIGSITGLRDTIDNLMAASPMTPAERSKLESVEAGAEVNVIETVKVNGEPLAVVDKAVDIPQDTELRRDVTALQAEVDGTQETDGLMDRMTAVEGEVETLAGSIDGLATSQELEDGLATKADATALTDGSVTKVGAADVGDAKHFVYLDDGVPTASASDIGSSSNPIYYKGSGSTAGFTPITSLEFGKSTGSTSDTPEYGLYKQGGIKVKSGKNQGKVSFICGFSPSTVTTLTGYSIDSSPGRLPAGLRITYHSLVNDHDGGQTEVALEIQKGQVAIIPRHHASYATVTPSASTVWSGRIPLSSYELQRVCIVTADGEYFEAVIGGGTAPTAYVVVNALGVKAVAGYLYGDSRSGVYFQVPVSVAYNVYIKEHIGIPNKEPRYQDVAAPETYDYNDVVYDGMHIPNVTNYDQLAWTSLIS